MDNTHNLNKKNYTLENNIELYSDNKIVSNLFETTTENPVINSFGFTTWEMLFMEWRFEQGLKLATIIEENKLLREQINFLTEEAQLLKTQREEKLSRKLNKQQARKQPIREYISLKDFNTI
jgi:hypothetical protein